MNRLLAHVRSNVIAYLALFVALGGTSYAAFRLPAGSVGNRQLRNGSVTAKKLSSKSIAGYVAFWASVGGDGQVFDSNPRATVTTPDAGHGIYDVTWNRRISQRCFLLTGLTSTADGAYANAQFEGNPKDLRTVVVLTYNTSALNVPEPVNVAVICP